MEILDYFSLPENERLKRNPTFLFTNKSKAIFTEKGLDEYLSKYSLFTAGNQKPPTFTFVSLLDFYSINIYRYVIQFNIFYLDIQKLCLELSIILPLLLVDPMGNHFICKEPCEFSTVNYGIKIRLQHFQR